MSGRNRRNLHRLVGALSAGLCALGASQLQAATPDYDLVIRGGRIVDGTGKPAFVGDVAVRGDTIVAVAPHIRPGKSRVIEARSLVVSPGFIDIHSHSERAQQGLISNPAAENNVRQGVTTVIANPDGFGSVNVTGFFEAVTAARPAINLGAFIGHGSVRETVMGRENRPATPAELDRMRGLVEQGMQAGAMGLSTGLFYVPANYAATSEVIELAKVAGRYGGIHQSHMRNEADGVLDSVRETIAIGELGGLPTQITHHKIIGKSNWGRSVETLKLVDEARARGVDVSLDQYPYTASSTSFEGAMVPQWAQEGGRAKMLARFDDPAQAARLRLEIANLIENDRGGGDPANVVLTSCDFDPALAGKNLAQLLKERGQPVTFAAGAELVIEIARKGSCSAVFHAIDEADLVRIMQHPMTMIASDASPGEPEFGRDVPHPRAYGTFARVLGVYVREKKVLSLEEAVRKMTSLPASRLHLTDRGVLRDGMKADIAIFDPATVSDRATFEQPHQYAVGVSYVLVNGEVVLADGAVTGARPGRVLRRSTAN